MNVNHNIPAPKLYPGERIAKYPWHLMRVGSSFFVPFQNERTRNQLQTACGYRRRNYGEIYTIKKMPRGFRVWRIQ